MLVEGVRAVSEALDAGADPVFGVTSPSLDTTEAGVELGGRLRCACETAVVEDDDLRMLADTDHPQGVLLVCREPDPGPELLPETGRMLVLDALQDPGNLGTLVRSSVAFGIDAVVCLDGTVDPWGPKAIRASAGAAFRIPILRAAADSAVDAMQAAGAHVVVATADGQRARDAMGGDHPLCALVVGNEGAGVRDSVRAISDAAVAVPMSGPAESLNAGVAGSILMYEWTR